MNVTRTAPTRLVGVALLRSYRIPLIWVCTLLLTSGVVLTGIESTLGRGRFLEDFWWKAAGITTKYWLLAVGATLVTVHLRSFVANGITRRAFVIGGAAFGIVTAVGLTALVVTTGALQILTGALVGRDGAGRSGVADFIAWSGQALPLMLAYLVSGLLFGAVYYRFGRRGMVLLGVPAALPLVLTESILGAGRDDRILLAAYPVALSVCLVVIGLGFAGAHRILSGVAIQRTTG